MMTNPNTAIAQQWLDAFNAHDLETLLALYAEDAAHYSPKLKLLKPHTEGLIKGRAAMRDWWKDALQRLPSLHYEVARLTADTTRVFMEYTRQVAGEADLSVAEVLEIKDGKIIASRVYHG